MEAPAIRTKLSEAFEKDGKLMTAKELAEVTDLTPQQAQGHVVAFRKTLTQLFVTEKGFLRTADGQVVWLRNSRGSMVLARHSESDREGHVISG